ncbi:MAG: hypothetical protein R3D30_12055 [Hyphomicrobiales bacterium]
MDPIERIDIRGDPTFALLLEAQWRGHDVFYYTPANLSLRDGKAGWPQPYGGRQAWRPLPARWRRAWSISPSSTSCFSAKTRRSTWRTSPRRIF